MRTKQKRGFFNFCFAFMPGAAEMYMGFMKMGISLMVTFLGTIGVIGLIELSDLFVIIPIVIWFYSFFHARNIATCAPEEFIQIKDDYFWNELLDGKELNIQSESAKKIIAWILIAAGVSMLWNMIIRPVMRGVEALADAAGLNFIYDGLYGIVHSIPQLIVAVLIITVGLKMIRGKKKQLQYPDSLVNEVMAEKKNTEVAPENKEEVRKDA